MRRSEWSNCAGNVRAIAGSLASYFRCEGIDLVKVSFESVLLEFVGRGAEGVGLDDVCAGAYVFGVNLAHEIRITQIQLVVAAIDVDAFGIKHRTHRAVEDEDAISGEKLFEMVPSLITDTKKSRAKQRGTSKSV